MALVGPESEEPAAERSQIVGVRLSEQGQTKRTDEEREEITERTSGSERVEEREKESMQGESGGGVYGAGGTK